MRVSALASDGSRNSVEFDFDFAAESLSDREKLRELERLRRVTKELMLKREDERIRAFRSQQRKELELRADSTGEEEPGR